MFGQQKLSGFGSFGSSIDLLGTQSHASNLSGTATTSGASGGTNSVLGTSANRGSQQRKDFNFGSTTSGCQASSLFGAADASVTSSGLFRKDRPASMHHGQQPKSHLSGVSFGAPTPASLGTQSTYGGTGLGSITTRPSGFSGGMTTCSTSFSFGEATPLQDSTASSSQSGIFASQDVEILPIETTPSENVTVPLQDARDSSQSETTPSENVIVLSEDKTYSSEDETTTLKIAVVASKDGTDSFENETMSLENVTVPLNAETDPSEDITASSQVEKMPSSDGTRPSEGVQTQLTDRRTKFQYRGRRKTGIQTASCRKKGPATLQAEKASSHNKTMLLENVTVPSGDGPDSLEDETSPLENAKVLSGGGTGLSQSETTPLQVGKTPSLDVTRPSEDVQAPPLVVTSQLFQAFGSTPSSSSTLFGNGGMTGTGSLFSTLGAGSIFEGFRGFRITTTQSSTGGLFGGATSGTPSFSFKGATPSQGGTTVAFTPPSGKDTMNFSTQHQCITAMKEYENKCFEELRMEDYLTNRKTKQLDLTTRELHSNERKQRIFGSDSTFKPGFPVSTVGCGNVTGTVDNGLRAGNTAAGFNASPGFGASTTSVFSSFFGQPRTMVSSVGFGAISTSAGFGGIGTNNGSFMTNDNTFGTNTGIFGTNTSPLFGKSTGGFGTHTNVFGASGFGTNGFGASGFGANTGGFGTKVFGTSNFGSNNAHGFCGFGMQPDQLGNNVGCFGGFGNPIFDGCSFVTNIGGCEVNRGYFGECGNNVGGFGNNSGGFGGIGNPRFKGCIFVRNIGGCGMNRGCFCSFGNNSGHFGNNAGGCGGPRS